MISERKKNEIKYLNNNYATDGKKNYPVQNMAYKYCVVRYTSRSVAGFRDDNHHIRSRHTVVVFSVFKIWEMVFFPFPGTSMSIIIQPCNNKRKDTRQSLEFKRISNFLSIKPFWNHTFKKNVWKSIYHNNMKSLLILLYNIIICYNIIIL